MQAHRSSSTLRRCRWSDDSPPVGPTSRLVTHSSLTTVTQRATGDGRVRLTALPTAVELELGPGEAVAAFYSARCNGRAFDSSLIVVASLCAPISLQPSFPHPLRSPCRPPMRCRRCAPRSPSSRANWPQPRQPQQQPPRPLPALASFAPRLTNCRVSSSIPIPTAD